MHLPNKNLRQEGTPLDSLFRLLDPFCIGGSLLAVIWLNQAHLGERAWLSAAVAIAAYLFVAEVFGLYRPWRGDTVEREVCCVAAAWTGAVGLFFATIGIFDFNIGIVQHHLLAWFTITPLLLISVRVVVRNVLQMLRARGFNTRTVAIVGVNELGLQLARQILASPEMGLKLKGFYDDRSVARSFKLPDDYHQRLGSVDELLKCAQQGEVDAVYVTLPLRAEERTRHILDQLSDSTASVYLVPDLFVFQLLHSRWVNLGGLAVVSVFETPFYGVDGAVKRLCDLVFGSIILALLSPLMLLIALLVKLTSPGPVFFRQRRYGLDGREIFVWKFRSMRVCEDGPTIAQATQGDVRITRLGAFIRKTSLDELPQLFNVLFGNMSLVGPRPHASAHNEQYRGRIQGYMLRHKVKPGITGLAQVNGWRGETDTLEKMERRVECDHQYIREWSLWLDLKILFRTIFVVLSRQNAY